MKTAYIETYGIDNLAPENQLPVYDAPMWWHDKGLQYTASGYGSKIPTRYKVGYNGRQYRVYVRQYSNAGTTYIVVKGEQKTIGFND